MLYRDRTLSIKFLYPFVVPALNAAFSLVLLIVFSDELYTNYVYLAATTSLIYLLLNMGMRLAVIRNDSILDNLSVFIYLKKVLIAFVVLSSLLSLIYGVINESSYSFLIVFVFGSLNLLLCDLLLGFNNSRGLVRQGYLYFYIFPKSIFILVYLSSALLELEYEYIYLLAVFCSLCTIATFVYSKSDFENKHCQTVGFSMPIKMAGEWGQIALYGLFMPGLIVFAEATEVELVKSIGIAMMIAQPMSILYQGSIAIKMKELKQLSSNMQNTTNINSHKIGTYNIISNIGLVGSIAHMSLLTLFLYFFADRLELLNGVSISIVVTLCSAVYVNSLFGPNGSLLGLLGKSHYDAFIALFKLLIVFISATAGADILTILFVSLLAEILGNVLKNLYIGWRLSTSLTFTLKPLILSLCVMVVIKYAYF